jgi:hypothetical protein
VADFLLKSERVGNGNVDGEKRLPRIWPDRFRVVQTHYRNFRGGELSYQLEISYFSLTSLSYVAIFGFISPLSRRAIAGEEFSPKFNGLTE